MTYTSSYITHDFLCLELAPPPEEEQHAIQVSIQEYPLNALGSSGFLPAEEAALPSAEPDEPSALALNISKRWAPGKILKIKFLGGNKAIQDKVKEWAHQWLLHANLGFSWVGKNEPAEIRIDFKPGGSSSFVGTYCLTIKDQSTSTMNLDISSDSSEELIRRKVLHEFGHVLGFEHEHQSPLATFQWNEEYIYRTLRGPPNFWNDKEIKHNVLNRLKSTDVQATPFDPDSIMLYAYPPEWFKNNSGQGTKYNTYLSKNDRDWASVCYSRYSKDIGQFSTVEVRPWDTPASRPDKKDVEFEPAYAQPPQIALGLTWLDLDHQNEISVDASAENIYEDSFRLNISSASSARLYVAACSWLEISSSEQDVFTGQFDVTSAWQDGKKQAQTERSIRFPQRFDNGPPVVVCWFSALDLGQDSRWKVNTYVTDISRSSFTIHVDADPATDLRGASVTWVAFRRGKEGMAGGSFSSGDIEGLKSTGNVEFEGKFDTDPHIMMALSGLDFENGHNLRLRLSSSRLEKSGFTWNLDTWLDSVMHGATGSFIAISQPEMSPSAW